MSNYDLAIEALQLHDDAIEHLARVVNIGLNHYFMYEAKDFLIDKVGYSLCEECGAVYIEDMCGCMDG